jgi:hypothetical protein
MTGADTASNATLPEADTDVEDDDDDDDNNGNT